MGIRHVSLAALMLIAGCSSARSKQLEAVKTVRSVLAEWALAERQAAAGHATQTYLVQMRKLASEELETAQSDLPGPGARVLGEMRQGQPGPDQLDAAARALAPLETSLEHS